METRNERAASRDRRFTEALDRVLAEAADSIRGEHHRLTALEFCDGMDAGRAGWALEAPVGARQVTMGPHGALWRVPSRGPSVAMVEGWVWCPWTCAPARYRVTHHGEDGAVERLTCDGCLRLYDATTGEALP